MNKRLTFDMIFFDWYEKATRKVVLFIFILFGTAPVYAALPYLKYSPRDSSSLDIYRATATKVNDLVHTRLDVKFDYAKHYLYGKAWITLKPHAYATDSLTLDAKGMDIHQIALVNGESMRNLKYTYDSKQLKITLPGEKKPAETYMIYIDYTAKPDERPKGGGSMAITDDKGLYFINSDKRDFQKPVQIWTQGETESSSCWFPTIDKPNQKTTEEISMTVPDQYVTLSNGRLDSQKKNSDGSRTDTWKMELPHAPYLFMMAVGDFKIYKDHWRNKEVNYYLEPKYAPYAKQIFGSTPEMMEFYSKTLGVDYPWNKYSQIVVRDYVSGAMENTTATLHGEYVQKTDKELLDENREDYIAHELFHQWFGDYVTCESWSNITVNESMAAFSEILWYEHKYGEEKADEERFEKLGDYLMMFQRGKSPELVRFHYKNKEDVFDAVSYNKGALILYMLRDLIGKEAFYKGLHIYLAANAFKSAEAPQLRLAFEEASGQDLNWFWNQWYYKGGHPMLSYSNSYDASRHLLTVKVKQSQPADVQTYRLPLEIEFSRGNKTSREKITITDREQEFSFKLSKKPDLVNLDPERIMVGKIQAESKTTASYAFQYTHAKTYAARYLVVNYALAHQGDPMVTKLLVSMLGDKNPALRGRVISGISYNSHNQSIPKEAIPIIEKLAERDPNNLTRVAAIRALSFTKDSKYIPLLKRCFQSESPAVRSTSLREMIRLDSAKAKAFANNPENKNNPEVMGTFAKLYADGGLTEHAAFFEHGVSEQSPEVFSAIFSSYLEFLDNSKDPAVVQRGIDLLQLKFKDPQLEQYKASLQHSFMKLAKNKKEMAANDSTGDLGLKKAYQTQAASLQKAAEELKK